MLLTELWNYSPLCFIIGALLLLKSVGWIFMNNQKKRFTAKSPTNVMITGGAMGLGKQLAQEFLNKSPPQSVNLIIVDIRADLESELKKDLKASQGDQNSKHVHFYQANLADDAMTK